MKNPVKFKSEIQEQFALKFKTLCLGKKLSTKKEIEKYSIKFYSFCLSKHLIDCPFPCYLEDYYYNN